MAKHKEQERREQEIETRRLDSQIREMNLDEKQVMVGHSYSLDLPVRIVEYLPSHSVSATWLSNYLYYDIMYICPLD